jgi:hypothetical protein
VIQEGAHGVVDVDTRREGHDVIDDAQSAEEK